jgi:23S rRNA (uracil1939-C5)-methyltransferase
MAHGGAAVGRYSGKAVFVPFGIPGETVRAEITQDKGRYARARLVEVLQPSPDRVIPRCPHFGACGGCQWQHMAYLAQLRFKEQLVRDAFARIGRLEAEITPAIGMTEPWGYRNHAQMVPDTEGRPGFQRAESNSVVPVTECRILHPSLQELLPQIELDFPGLTSISLRCGVATGERMLVLETAGDEAPAIEMDLPVSCILALEDGNAAVLAGAPYLHERVAGRAYRVSPASFFQVNTWGAEQLVALVRDHLEEMQGARLLDAYCGVGLFSLSLAGRFAGVVGIEAAPSSVADARANAIGLATVEFRQGSVEEMIEPGERFDAVILDPPRAGASPAALSALLSVQPSRIVYVSCDPATLARDCAAIVARGYRLATVQPVDMFPQTAHVEAVACLVQTDPSAP